MTSLFGRVLRRDARVTPEPPPDPEMPPRPQLHRPPPPRPRHGCAWQTECPLDPQFDPCGAPPVRRAK